MVKEWVLMKFLGKIRKLIIILNHKCKAMLSYCLKCEKIQKT